MLKTSELFVESCDHPKLNVELLVGLTRNNIFFIIKEAILG